MKNFWKYALIGIMAICLLFSFTACDDDDDDDDDVVYCTLEDETITNLVAQALVSAITDNLAQSTTGYTSTYSTWTPVMSSDYTMTGLTITVTSAYTGEVTLDDTTYYTVVIKKGSDIEVDLSTYYVEVDVDSTIDGAEADIDLEGYAASGSVSEFEINDTASTYDASALLTTLVSSVTNILNSSSTQSE